MEQILSEAFGPDGTQLATAEKQLLLSRLLARLAHEIRNPLSSLDVHVQLLEEDLGSWAPELRGKAAGRFEIIKGELHRLEGVVKRFLRLAGSSELEVEPVDLGKVLRHVQELLRPEAAHLGIEVVVAVPEGFPVILADAGQLTQALLNLVINALQAVEHDGKVEVRASLGPESTLLIEVADTGPGVPRDKQATIFEPFFTTKPEGSGLGLWIVQQIVTAHRGEIRVTNGATSGAVFTLCLPLTPSGAGASAAGRTGQHG